MAQIRPFRAWRYNEEVVPNVMQMFSPLYDVIGKEQLEALYKIPRNSIHISVPRSGAESQAKLLEWKQRGVIRQDPVPGIYIYYQDFSLFGEQKRYVRKGFVSLVRMEPREGSRVGDVILHEDTIAASVEERTRVLAQTLLNVAPTHGLYDDPAFELEALMDRYMQCPDYTYTDYQGVVNRVAIVQHKGDIEAFMQVLASRKIYLADGHHRLASSVALLEQTARAQGPLPEDHPFRYHMMFLSNLRADDLRILPIHRVFTQKGYYGRAQDLLRRFEPWFTWKDVTMNKRPLVQELHGKARTFGMVAGERQYLITLRPEFDPVRDIQADVPAAVKDLDYTVLQYFVFGRIFGIPYHEMSHAAQVEYLKDSGTALKAAIHDPQKITFIMNEVRMDQMLAVCESGAIMPMKSTFFYPKVVCGLVFATIDPHEYQGPFDTGLRFTPA